MGTEPHPAGGRPQPSHRDWDSQTCPCECPLGGALEVTSGCSVSLGAPPPHSPLPTPHSGRMVLREGFRGTSRRHPSPAWGLRATCRAPRGGGHREQQAPRRAATPPPPTVSASGAAQACGGESPACALHPGTPPGPRAPGAWAGGGGGGAREGAVLAPAPLSPQGRPPTGPPGVPGRESDPLPSASRLTRQGPRAPPPRPLCLLCPPGPRPSAQRPVGWASAPCKYLGGGAGRFVSRMYFYATSSGLSTLRLVGLFWWRSRHTTSALRLRARGAPFTPV